MAKPAAQVEATRTGTASSAQLLIEPGHTPTLVRAESRLEPAGFRELAFRRGGERLAVSLPDRFRIRSGPNEAASPSL